MVDTADVLEAWNDDAQFHSLCRPSILGAIPLKVFAVYVLEFCSRSLRGKIGVPYEIPVMHVSVKC